MTDDNEDGWLDVEVAIDSELTACYLGDGHGILLELVSNQAAHRIAWTREQAEDLLDQLAEELDRVAFMDGDE